MKTREKVLELRQQGLIITEIAKILNIGKGTVGFHLKDYPVNNQKIKKKKFDYWEVLNGNVIFESSYRNNIRGQIKRFIRKNNILPYKCECCGCNDQWMGKTMPLILDHKNGINNDHKLGNLRFLCSNCDSIQDTYKNKNASVV